MVEEHVGSTIEAHPQTAVEHAVLRQRLYDMEPNPPMAPSSIVSRTSCSRASFKTSSTSSGFMKRASAMVVDSHGLQFVRRLLAFAKTGSERQ